MSSVRSPASWAALIGLAALPLSAGLMVWMSVTDAGDPDLASIRLSKRSEMEETDPSLWPHRIYDAFPPLVQFAIVAAQEIGSEIADDEFVLGVEIAGEARAYPLNMMGKPGNEVVNDRLGGQLVAVTFCGLCEAPLVFSRRLDDKTLTFYVSGMVIGSNMVIKDVETRSEWSQLLGRAVAGPLEGKELQQFPSVWVDWKTWRTAHPRTTAIRLERGNGKYSTSRIRALSAKERSLEALQWGLARGGKARSWPFSRLARQPVLNDAFAGMPLLIVFDPESLSPKAFDRRVDGKELTFRLRGGELIDEATGTAWDPVTGRALRGPLEGRRLSPVAGTIATATTWRDFHRDSQVWDPDGRPAEVSGPVAGGK